MNGPRDIASILIEETAGGLYRARVVVGGSAQVTCMWSSLEALLQHVGRLIEDRRAAEEADPRAWVV